MYINLHFVPNYVDIDALHNNEAPQYDMQDTITMTKLIYSALTLDPAICEETNISKLIDLYYTDNELVFNDDGITVNDVPVYEIEVREYTDNPDVPEEYISVYVRCNNGSLNIAVDKRVELRKAIYTWLIGYIIKRLGMDNVIKSNIFRDYWLMNQR